MISSKQVNDTPKVINQKYANFIGIRNNFKRVEITNLETGSFNIYPLIQKASRALGHGTIVILDNDGKVWREQYAIKVL